MRVLRGLPSVAMILALLTGCSSALEPAKPRPAEVRAPSPTDGSLTTAKESYSANCQRAGYDKMCTFKVALIYTNQTEVTIYFDHCYPDDTYPIYFVGGLTQEESAYSGAWGCTGHDRFVKVLAGKQRVDMLMLRGPNSWDGVTGKPYGLLEGRLQIHY